MDDTSLRFTKLSNCGRAELSSARLWISLGIHRHFSEQYKHGVSLPEKVLPSQDPKWRNSRRLDLCVLATGFKPVSDLTRI